MPGQPKKRPDMLVQLAFGNEALVDDQITPAISESFATKGERDPEGFLVTRERHEKDQCKNSSATKQYLSSMVLFVLSATGCLGPAAFIKAVGDADLADQPRERARWAPG